MHGDSVFQTFPKNVNDYSNIAGTAILDLFDSKVFVHKHKHSCFLHYQLKTFKLNKTEKAKATSEYAWPAMHRAELPSTSFLAAGEVPKKNCVLFSLGLGSQRERANPKLACLIARAECWLAHNQLFSIVSVSPDPRL